MCEGKGEVVAVYEGDVIERIGFVGAGLEGDFEKCCGGISLVDVRIIYCLDGEGRSYSNNAV